MNTTPENSPKKQTGHTGGKKKNKWPSMLAKILIPLAVTVGLCWVMFRDLDFGEMMHIIRTQCDFRFIALSLTLGFIPVILRGLRWGIQLRYNGITPPKHILVYSIFGTYAVNLVFPRLGEVWRSGYISYRQHAPFSEVFGSMVADRLSDTLAVFLILLGTLLVARGPIDKFLQTYPDMYNTISGILASPWFWGATAIIIGASWATLHFSHNSAVLKIKNFFLGLWGGFVAIFRMKGKLKWLLMTCVIWFVYFLQLYVAFYAFPFTREMLATHGVSVALVCYVLTSLSMAVPSNGGIGPYQACMLFGLTVFEPAAAAGSHAFTTNALTFGNLVIASQTAMWIIMGIIVFALITIDRHFHPDGAPEKKTATE